MAESMKGKKARGKKSGRSKKNKDAPADNGGGSAAGIGHNITEIRKVALPIFERLDALQTAMDSAMGEFRVDFKNLYEEGANAIGCSRKVLREEFANYKHEKRKADREAAYEPSERDEIDALRAALEGTPFGEFLAGKLAEADKEDED